MNEGKKCLPIGLGNIRIGWNERRREMCVERGVVRREGGVVTEQFALLLRVLGDGASECQECQR